MIQLPGKITPKSNYDPENVALLATLKNHFQSACDSLKNNKQQQRRTGFTTSALSAQRAASQHKNNNNRNMKIIETFQLKQQEQQQPEQLPRNLNGKYIFGLERHLSRDNNGQSSTMITDSFLLPSSPKAAVVSVSPTQEVVVERPPSGYLARRPVSATIAGTRLKPTSLPRSRVGQKPAEPAAWTQQLFQSDGRMEQQQQPLGGGVYLLKKM